MTIFQQLEKRLGKNQVEKDISLARYTTLKVGGAAKYFFSAKTTEAVVNAVRAAQAAQIDYFVLGGGSNVVISDQGVEALVIHNQANEIKLVKRLGQIKPGKVSTGQVLLQVDSGVMVNRLVRYCCDVGFEGLERHLGLPGTVGGGLYMNSKWTKPVVYIGDVLYKAKIITRQGQIIDVDRKYFNFGYDQSSLQKTRDTVLTATFLLEIKDSKLLWQRAQDALKYRQISQPSGVFSAGCTFRNISLVDAIRIGTPNCTTSAGYLLDQVGLKNFRVGGARFSDKHANFIINDNWATAMDIKALVNEAQKRVKQKFRVNIETEVVFWGKFS